MISDMKKIEGVAQIISETDRISVSIDENKISIEKLHQEICALGAKIYMFQPETMDMESAFMKLTAGKVQ